MSDRPIYMVVDTYRPVTDLIDLLGNERLSYHLQSTWMHDGPTIFIHEFKLMLKFKFVVSVRCPGQAGARVVLNINSYEFELMLTFIN